VSFSSSLALSGGASGVNAFPARMTRKLAAGAPLGSFHQLFFPGGFSAVGFFLFKKRNSEMNSLIVFLTFSLRRDLSLLTDSPFSRNLLPFLPITFLVSECMKRVLPSFPSRPRA